MWCIASIQKHPLETETDIFLHAHTCCINVLCWFETLNRVWESSEGSFLTCRGFRVYAKHLARIPNPPAKPWGTLMLKVGEGAQTCLFKTDPQQNHWSSNYFLFNRDKQFSSGCQITSNQVKTSWNFHWGIWDFQASPLRAQPNIMSFTMCDCKQ